MGGTRVSRKVLEDVRLIITSTDLDNVTTTKEVADFELFDDRETTYEFQMPQRLAGIQFQLRARVQNQSQNQKIELSADQTFSLNEIDRTDKTEDLHFARVGSERRRRLCVDLLGKTGEAKADRPVHFAIKLREYKLPVASLVADRRRGRIVLGRLPGVEAVTAKNRRERRIPGRFATTNTPIPCRSSATDQPLEVPTWAARKSPIGPNCRCWSCAATILWPIASTTLPSTAGCSRSASCRRGTIRC